MCWLGVLVSGSLDVQILEKDLRSDGLFKPPGRLVAAKRRFSMLSGEKFILKTGQLARRCVGLRQPGEVSDGIFILCTTYQPSRLCSLSKSFHRLQ